jgi:hypothetical protein
VVPLEEYVSAATLDALAEGSPGRSHQSYRYAGRQWAFAIDAARRSSGGRTC